MSKKKYNQRPKIFYVIIIAIFSCLLYFSYQYFTEYNLVEIVTVNKEVKQRELIKENDLTYLKVPSYLINDDIVVNREDIVNHYVALNNTLLPNILINRSSIESDNSFTDYGNLLLNENESAFSIVTSLTESIANNFNVSMLVDIYLTIDDNNNVVSDALFQNARIIGVKNSEGKDVVGSEVPYLIILAVNKENLPLLNICERLGDFSLYVSNDSYLSKPTKLVSESKILLYLEKYEEHYVGS